jgi:hypothetical protein
MNTKLIVGLSIAAIIAIGASVSLLSTNAPLPSPIYISHSPLVTATISPTSTPIPSPSASASQAPVPTPTPAPTIIPGARPSDWKTYRNYEWRFEVKIPPNWTAEQVGYGLVISGDKAAIRIDNDGVGGNEGATTEPTITTRTVAGQEVEVADGTFFVLKRNGDIPFYYFRISNWTDTVDKILSTFKSW